jgi:PAS domain S-box-containing protein
MSQGLRSTATRFAAAIGALYAASGVTWIFLSDALVSRLAATTESLELAQRYKGIAFIAVTSVMLSVLVRGGYLRLLRALERARAGEFQVQGLFLKHPEPMWVYDVDTLNFLAVNDAAVRHYGFSNAEFLSMSVRDISSADGTRRLGESLDGDKTRQGAGIFRHTKKDNDSILVDITSHAVPFHGHRARLVMAQDVTQEALSKATIDRQERQFRQLHDSLQEALWIYSVDQQRVFYVSAAFDTVYGRAREELVRDPSLWSKVIHEEDVSAALEAITDLRITGRSEREYRIERPDGELRWVCDRRRNIVGADGAVLMVGGIVEDITKSKSAALALQRLNEQLEVRVRSRTEELQFVNEELDAFTRTAAHDLRTPLNAISGFVQILRFRYKQALGVDGDKIAEHIESAVAAMTQLVTDLLALSRVGTHELRLVPTDVSALARQIATDLRVAEPQRRVKTTISPTLNVLADKGLVRSLMTNLLGNAWKYTGQRDVAHIEVGCTKTGDTTEFFVRDDGAGFDAGDAELFKPFQRFHAASDFPGTGVGLATCQRIVRRHGGSIWLTSTRDIGTTVYFTLGPTAHLSQHPVISEISTFENEQV